MPTVVMPAESTTLGGEGEHHRPVAAHEGPRDEEGGLENQRRQEGVEDRLAGERDARPEQQPSQGDAALAPGPRCGSAAAAGPQWPPPPPPAAAAAAQPIRGRAWRVRLEACLESMVAVE